MYDELIKLSKEIVDSEDEDDIQKIPSWLLYGLPTAAASILLLKWLARRRPVVPTLPKPPPPPMLHRQPSPSRPPNAPSKPTIIV
jgi:hypothetical protein